MFQFALLASVACFNNVYVTNWSEIVLCRPMWKFLFWPGRQTEQNFVSKPLILHSQE